MESEWVFVDTEVYRSAGFNLLKPELRRYNALCEARELQPLTTAITERELEGAVHEVAAEIYRGVQRFRGRLHVFDHFQASIHGKALDEVTVPDVEESLRVQLVESRQRSHTVQIDEHEGAVTRVFERYFEGRPPFSEGKKKNEFPDAFVLDSLEQWALGKTQKINVVSGDPDLAQACAESEVLVHVGSMAGLLDIYNAHNRLARDVLAGLLSRDEDLCRLIEEALMGSGYYVDDEDGDIEDIRVDDVETQNYYIIDLKETEAVVSVEYDATVTAEVTYLDTARSAWDSEEGRWLGKAYLTAEVPIEVESSAEVSVAVSDRTPPNWEMDVLGLGLAGDVPVRVASGP